MGILWRIILFIYLDLLAQHSCPTLRAIWIFIWKLKKKTLGHQSFLFSRSISKSVESLQLTQSPASPWQGTEASEMELDQSLPGPACHTPWSSEGAGGGWFSLNNYTQSNYKPQSNFLASTLSSLIPGGHPPGCCWRDCTPAPSWEEWYNEKMFD